MTEQEIKPKSPFTKEDVMKIESAVGYKLPKDYREFIEKFGGAVIGGDVDGSSAFPIMCFLNASEKNGVLSNGGEFEEFRSLGILPIGRCGLNNVWVLDIEEGNTIHYVNYYGGEAEVTKVADSFQEFFDRIVIEKEEEDDDDEEEEETN